MESKGKSLKVQELKDTNYNIKSNIFVPCCRNNLLSKEKQYFSFDRKKVAPIALAFARLSATWYYKLFNLIL